MNTTYLQGFYIKLLTWLKILKLNIMDVDIEDVCVSPEEGYKDNQRAGAPLLWRLAERVGFVQFREGLRVTLLQPSSI